MVRPSAQVHVPPQTIEWGTFITILLWSTSGFDLVGACAGEVSSVLFNMLHSASLCYNRLQSIPSASTCFNLVGACAGEVRSIMFQYVSFCFDMFLCASICFNLFHFTADWFIVLHSASICFMLLQFVSFCWPTSGPDETQTLAEPTLDRTKSVKRWKKPSQKLLSSIVLPDVP
jgi:hypothetical protein